MKKEREEGSDEQASLCLFSFDVFVNVGARDSFFTCVFFLREPRPIEIRIFALALARRGENAVLSLYVPEHDDSLLPQRRDAAHE